MLEEFVPADGLETLPQGCDVFLNHFWKVGRFYKLPAMDVWKYRSEAGIDQIVFNSFLRIFSISAWILRAQEFLQSLACSHA